MYKPKIKLPRQVAELLRGSRGRESYSFWPSFFLNYVSGAKKLPNGDDGYHLVLAASLSIRLSKLARFSL